MLTNSNSYDPMQARLISPCRMQHPKTNPYQSCD